MKIIFINPFQYFSINRHLHRRFPVPAVTLPYLMSLVPDHHDVRIVDEANEKVDYSISADLVCITTLSVNAERAYAISKEFRRRGISVVMGGPHASAVPQEAKRHCDAVALGNAESTMVQIIDDAERGQLKPFYENTEPTCIPSQITGSIGSSWQTSILASRGCELNCDFCSMQHIFGKFYIQRDSRPVLEDIEKVDTPYITFVDDNFYGATRKSHAFYDEIIAAIARTGKRWIAQVRLPVLRKEEILNKFRDSGCVGVFVGFESINPKNRAEMGKQRIDKELFQRQIEKIHSKGIGVIGSFIFGFDEDTPETIDETVEFCIESKMELTAFSVLTPYPGTAVYKNFKEQNRILSENWSDYDSDKVVYQPRHFAPKELEQHMLRAAKKFYSISSIYKRMKFGMNYDTVRLYLAANFLRKYSLMTM